MSHRRLKSDLNSSRLLTRIVLLNSDDEQTWSARLRTEVARWNAALSPQICWQDASIPSEVLEVLEADLHHGRVLTFHCSRLFDHEVDLIRAEGLKPFSRSLFERKIVGALERGLITAQQADDLLVGNMYGCNDLPKRGNREGQVWLNSGFKALSDDPDAFSELLHSWGGEGIYFATGTTTLRPLLQSIGTPTMIVLALPFVGSERPHSWWGPLANLLLATHRGIVGHSDIICWSEVAADAVLEVWRPGDPDYDRHWRLPRD